MSRLRNDAHGAIAVDDVNEERFRWHWVKVALRAPHVYLCSLAWIFLLVSLYVSFVVETHDDERGKNGELMHEIEFFSIFANHYSGPQVQPYRHAALHCAAQHDCLFRGPTYIHLLGSNQGSWCHHGWRLYLGNRRLHHVVGCQEEFCAIRRHISGGDWCLPWIGHDHGTLFFMQLIRSVLMLFIRDGYRIICLPIM